MQSKVLTQPCKKCGTIAWERLQRKGFFEEKVLSLFGRYPWRCAVCNVRHYFPLRYDPARVRRSRGQRVAI